MSVELTCDLCGKRNIGRDYVSDRLKTKVGKVQTETMIAIDGGWNSGDLCYECVVAHFSTAFAAGESSSGQPTHQHAAGGAA